MSKESKKMNGNMSKVAEENKKEFLEYMKKNLEESTQKDYKGTLNRYHKRQGFYNICSSEEWNSKMNELENKETFKTKSDSDDRSALRKYGEFLKEREKLQEKNISEMENLFKKYLIRDGMASSAIKTYISEVKKLDFFRICSSEECRNKIERIKETDYKTKESFKQDKSALKKYCEFLEEMEKKNGKENATQNKDSKLSKNIILYGPPGTGKTYNTVKYAVAIIERRDVEEVKNEDHKEILRKYSDFKEAGQIEFITFHQSYGYEEFIQGIKPEVKNGQVVYEVESGIFKEFCEKAEGKDEPYVFIIDEINRGNISKIFGELITLIEEDKRTDKNDKNVGLRVKLPYMKENEKPFGVPNNVYIIGTMNTADRSIALMDTALRRRFQFVEMMPDTNVLKDKDKAIEIKDNEGKDTNIDLVKMLNTMNERIEILYDREHTIGHGYFTSLKNDNSINELGNIFEKKIIPLLQEYFYDDYENISKVLGDDNATEVKNKFIKSMEKSEDIGNDDFDKIYRKNEECDFLDKETYKKIYEKKDEKSDD